MKGDKFDGQCRIAYPYGDVYEGQWDHGNRVGVSSWQAEKGTFASHLYGTKKRLSGGPDAISDLNKETFYVGR